MNSATHQIKKAIHPFVVASWGPKKQNSKLFGANLSIIMYLLNWQIFHIKFNNIKKLSIFKHN